MHIYCCGCGDHINARLTHGSEVYPHREDLARLPFWRCDHCGNFVGCHHKTKQRTRPLGCIPSPTIRNARKHIHNLIDPVWKSGAVGRNELYKKLSDATGRKYHTANIRSIPEARNVYRLAKSIIKELEDIQEA